MNNYPKWWDSTVTVFNKFEKSNGEITWYKTVLTNCFWKYAGTKITLGETTLDTNTVTCRIPKNDNYLAPYLWNDLEDKSTKFTLKQDDIIVLGTPIDTIDEYTEGLRSSDVLHKYKALQGCMKVEAVSDNSGANLGNQHYLARGK